MSLAKTIVGARCASRHPVGRLGSLLLAFLLFSACTTLRSSAIRNLLGLHPGETKSEVHATLTSIGSLLREAPKRQEVWELRDARYSGAIVGYDDEGRVRFITAVAKEGGSPVRYSDVLDVTHAELRSAGNSRTYLWKGRESSVTAIGNDPEHLTYVTLKRTDDEKEEREDD